MTNEGRTDDPHHPHPSSFLSSRSLLFSPLFSARRAPREGEEKRERERDENEWRIRSIGGMDSRVIRPSRRSFPRSARPLPPAGRMRRGEWGWGTSRLPFLPPRDVGGDPPSPIPSPSPFSRSFRSLLPSSIERSGYAAVAREEKGVGKKGVRSGRAAPSLLSSLTPLVIPAPSVAPSHALRSSPPFFVRRPSLRPWGRERHARHSSPPVGRGVSPSRRSLTPFVPSFPHACRPSTLPTATLPLPAATPLPGMQKRG